MALRHHVSKMPTNSDGFPSKPVSFLHAAGCFRAANGHVLSRFNLLTTRPRGQGMSADDRDELIHAATEILSASRWVSTQLDEFLDRFEPAAGDWAEFCRANQEQADQIIEEMQDHVQFTGYFIRHFDDIAGKPPHTS
ncbi:MAG: hypothetical protein PHE83_16695 [Opitutaceae bacterium]|nr:hypothetical protein [Opitutaceae bacterium]